MKVGKSSVAFWTILFILSIAQVSLAQIKTGFSDYYVSANGNTDRQNLDENVTPIVKLFGSYMGGALFNTGNTHGLLGFDVGVKGIILFIDDNLKTDWTGTSGVKGGPLGEFNTVPIPMLQAGIGLIGNLEVVGRFFSYPIAETPEGKAENISVIGGGIKYGVIQNFALPRVSVMASYHKLIVPEAYEFADVNTVSLDLIISKSVPMLATVYGAVGVDRSSMSLEIPEIKEQLDYSESMFRGVVGVKFDFLPFVYISTDYNFGVNRGLNVGLGLSIR
jgi:hypothetical protein